MEDEVGGAEFEALVRLLAGRSVVVLSGAGCSTDSGIPDYRSPGRPARSPMRFQEFMASPEARARYWGRSSVGWSRFSRARPNAAHRALAALERAGIVRAVITQNVDGLHQRAGSRRVIELHGSLAQVRCVACGNVERRASVQARLQPLLPSFKVEPGRIAPDGDAELPAWVHEGAAVPDCLRCGGILKPDVVFFGENVPRDRLEEAWEAWASGEVLLVVGSSLAVFSGRRFVLRAAREGMPVAIVNLGPTRGDEFAALRLPLSLGEVLPRLATRLTAG